ncbi:hypothetical protein D3C71_1849090 [compost metagenome]
MPACVWKLAAQGANGFWPISGFACTGQDDQGASWLAAVGRFPEREEGITAGLQGLLLDLRDLALQRQGIFLAAFEQWLTLDRGRLLFGRCFWWFTRSRECATR